MRRLIGLLAITCLVIAASMLPFVEAAFAASSDIFTTLQTKGSDAFTNTRNIIFILGAFGIIGLGVLAFFGRFQWGWAFSLVGGLVVIAAAGGVMYYLTNTASTGSSTNYSSTLPTTDTLR